MRSLVILLDAANSTNIERSEKLHTTQCESLYSKRKSHYLFQLDHIQLQSAVSSVTFWKYIVQAVPSKKKKRGRRRKGKRWKRGEEEKRDGKSLCVRKGKRENEMWKKRRN